MLFKLEITCDNSAFDDCTMIEIARLLEYAARSVRDDIDYRILYDINGNQVGFYDFGDFH